MTNTIDRDQQGRIAVRKLMGDAAADGICSRVDQKGFGSAAATRLLESCFADIWADPALEWRYRSIATIVALISVRQPVELQIHFGIALSLGFSEIELEALAIHCGCYLGVAAQTMAMRALELALVQRMTG